MKQAFLLLLLLFSFRLQAQISFPVNDVADNRTGLYAFTGATIITAPGLEISNATLLIRNGLIVSVGNNIKIPADAVVINSSGKYIYPSFIDIYTDYGMPPVPRIGMRNVFNSSIQFLSGQKGAFGWNQALRNDMEAGSLFGVDTLRSRTWRDFGFGAALTHHADGISRGTGAVVTFGIAQENMVVLKEKAAAHYSFSKGSSPQSYPSSMMGSIALLRQTYLDALWYKNNPAAEGINLTLQKWNEQQSLPQIFEANDKWNVLRADRIGDEFGVQYIIKAGGNEYQRIREMSATGASFILPLNFPAPMDVEDVHDAHYISLSDLKHWELAPGNPAQFEKAGIPFCITMSDLRDNKQFWPNLRKAIQYGLSETRALEALTTTPAKLLGLSDHLGTLTPGKIANFIITNGPLFEEKTTILQNWIQGNKYKVKDELWNDLRGKYLLTLQLPKEEKRLLLEVLNNSSAQILSQDTLKAKFSCDGKLLQLNFPYVKAGKQSLRLSGVSSGKEWSGMGEDSTGQRFTWTARYQEEALSKKDSVKKKIIATSGTIPFPFNGYGFTSTPVQESVLFRNTTIWTNEKEGKLENGDVLVRNGKIIAVGKNLSADGAKVIDGSGMHLTAGIIDEHSHIAASSINEGGQSVTSEVRITDNLNPDDINIYRQLSGGVTSSHILHGSANTIGGQTQLIKLRWGANDDELKFKGWPGFIKFALGENVKRSGTNQNNRFPDTRMGVSQVLIDAFTRAREYEAEWKRYETEKKKNPKHLAPRRDLELEALVEILNKQRFITCHSYVQSEIVDMMRVAERFGFTLNTFTHILEGYKVADKMKQHGAHVSSFSDWWNYKMEVVDAIPFNAAIMQKVGLNVAINSDDAEMARRLNQEAAKAVKYGGVSEEEALKMVTLNPAIMLHVDDKTGSIKVGKDADLVLWSDHPLSIYAKAMKTMVDGIIYYDRERDEQLRKDIAKERTRLISRMTGEKNAGAPTVPFAPSMEIMHSCSDHQHRHGLFVIDEQ